MFDDTIEIFDDIIAAVMGMTGVKADPKPVLFGDTFIDGGEFFEGPSNLGAFSRHGLQRDQAVGVIGQNFVEPPDDGGSPGFCSRSHMGPRMEDQDAAPHGTGADQLQPEKIHSKLISLGLYRVGQIDDIGGMDDKFLDPLFFHQRLRRFYMQFTDFFAPGILGRSGIEHKCVCLIRERFLHRTLHHLFSIHPHMGSDF